MSVFSEKDSLILEALNRLSAQIHRDRLAIIADHKAAAAAADDGLQFKYHTEAAARWQELADNPPQ
jgi:hypothetical protein